MAVKEQNWWALGNLNIEKKKWNKYHDPSVFLSASKPNSVLAAEKTQDELRW